MTQTLLCAMWTFHPMQHHGSLLSGSYVLVASPWSSVQAWYHLLWTGMRGHAWSLLLQRCWRNCKEEEAAVKKAVTKEEFQGEWTAPAAEFPAVQPEVADWSKGIQIPSVPIQQFPTEDLWCSACLWGLGCSPHCSGHWMGGNNHWVVLSCSSTSS